MPPPKPQLIKQEALKDATFIIHAVPVQYSRKFLEGIAPHVPKGTPIISTSKVRPSVDWMVWVRLWLYAKRPPQLWNLQTMWADSFLFDSICRASRRARSA